MLIPGLVSVTFRNLSPQEIIDLVLKSGLEGIEWGGDVHIPPEEIDQAKEIAQICSDAGIRIPSFGSYYRLGAQDQKAITNALECASILGAGNIRVWAGEKGSLTTDPETRQRVIQDGRIFCDAAAERKIAVSLEFHTSTLTDTLDSTIELLREVDRSNLHSYWQPREEDSPDGNLQNLRSIKPYLTNVHCFHRVANIGRRPLFEGWEYWEKYLRTLLPDTQDHWVLLEFVQQDEPENFLRDAQTLKGWLQGLNRQTG